MAEKYGAKSVDLREKTTVLLAERQALLAKAAEQAKAKALELGFFEAQIFDPKDLIYDERTWIKCLQGCIHPRSRVCPDAQMLAIPYPNLGWNMGKDLMEKYSIAVQAIKWFDPKEYTAKRNVEENKLAVKWEMASVYKGWYFATVLRFGGPCKLCLVDLEIKGCPAVDIQGGWCPPEVAPFARPCPEAIGFDVIKSARKIGAKDVFHIREHQSTYGDKCPFLAWLFID